MDGRPTNGRLHPEICSSNNDNCIPPKIFYTETLFNLKTFTIDLKNLDLVRWLSHCVQRIWKWPLALPLAIYKSLDAVEQPLLKEEKWGSQIRVISECLLNIWIDRQTCSLICEKKKTT